MSGLASVAIMRYESPLGYLLGLEGWALLRAFGGEHGGEFVEARIAEIRRLLDDETLAEADVSVDRLDTVDGYRVWSQSYDVGRNGLFDIDEPVMHEILDALAPGVALDAACGTGRYAEYLAGRGHQVVGVDGSPDMLARARARVPSAEFRAGDLHRLPVSDDEVDAIVCALALTHVRDLAPVFAEFARVLRPGGHLVVADVHPELVLYGSIPTVVGPDGQRGRLSAYRHRTGDYLRAALPQGLQVRRCEEPGAGVADATPVPEAPAEIELGAWEVWPWSLAANIPEAARAATAGNPSVIIWHFQLAG